MVVVGLGQVRDAARVELTLANDPRSAVVARRAVDRLAGHAHPETLAKARLLITEMVATVITTASTQAEIRVLLIADAGLVRGEVSSGRGLGARPIGWALLLVRKIANRWGMRHGTLWFEVEGG
jgi:hypothetical protein